MSAFKLGLTGSIGMGKSTTLGFFEDEGVPIWSADRAVHEIYANDQSVISAISKLAPDAVIDNQVDRQQLTKALQSDENLFPQIESIVHPAVKAHRQAFLDAHVDAKLVVLELPLLFEIQSESDFDAVAVVSVDYDVQKARVLARQGMSERQFNMILSRQMPDDEKRKKADYVIRTDTLDAAKISVHNLIKQLIEN